MDRREFAIRQYEELAARRPRDWNRATFHQLRDWLRDDACAAAEAYVMKPAFQRQAAWSVRSLVPGIDTPERALVAAVDASLVRAAKQLQSVVALPAIEEQLAANNPPTRRISRECVEIGSQGTRVLEREFDNFDELAMERSQVEAIATHFWDDLVSPLDYFGPFRAFRFNDRTEPQWGNFLPSFNRILHPVGDFVIRCMLERVETLTQMLAAHRSRVLTAVSRATNGGNGDEETETEREAWAELTGNIANLREAHGHGTAARLRDSCVILTQVYAAFHPAPRLDWLGLPESFVTAGRAQLQGRCTSWTGPELFDRVAVSLGDLGTLYGNALPQQSAIDEAIATGGLVVEKGTCTVHWNGKRVEPPKPWYSQRRQFEILCKLAETARAGGEISAGDIYEKIVGGSTLSTAVNRLREQLVHEPDLEVGIVGGSKPGTYRFELPRDRVFVF
jgi:hypothetical protein